jgi:hypothetical protein
LLHLGAPQPVELITRNHSFGYDWASQSHCRCVILAAVAVTLARKLWTAAAADAAANV